MEASENSRGYQPYDDFPAALDMYYHNLRYLYAQNPVMPDMLERARAETEADVAAEKEAQARAKERAATMRYEQFLARQQAVEAAIVQRRHYEHAIAELTEWYLLQGGATDGLEQYGPMTDADEAVYNEGLQDV